MLNYILTILAFCLIIVWPNFIKKAKATRAEYFYWDFVLSAFALSLLFAVIIGLSPYYNLPSLEKDLIIRFRFALRALIAGFILNSAYFLTILSSFLVGITYAYNVSFAVAMVTGSVINILIDPHGFPRLVPISMAFYLLSILFFNICCKRNSEKTFRSKKAIGFSTASGILFGFFYPLLGKSFSLEDTVKLGPHIAILFFVSGFVLSNTFLSFLFKNRPLIAPEFSFKGYFEISFKNHLYGIYAGLFWGGAIISRFFTNVKDIYNFTFFFAHIYTLVIGLLGIFVWKEYKAHKKTHKYLFLAYLAFILGAVFLSFNKQFLN